MGERMVLKHGGLRRAFFFSTLPVLLAPWILLAPVYLRGQALFWGTPLLQFVPWWHYAWQVLSSGHLPLWNPYLGMGAPLLANYQSALFYPPTWLYFLLASMGGVEWMAWGQAPLVAAHLAWSGLGMLVLARRLGLGPLAQGVAGLSYGLSGYLVARAGFFSINSAAAWLPWVLFGLTAILEAVKPREKRRSLALLALFMGLQLLSGHAQTTWYTLLLVGLWAVFRWIGMWRLGQSRQVLDSALRLSLALLLALGLAAVQLLPTAEYLMQSQRSAAVDFDYALNYSFWPWHLLNFLAAGLFGSPATGDYWGYANYWEDAVYVGVLPLLLALSALWASLRRKSPQVAAPGLQPGFIWFLWAVLGISLLLALGRFTPIYPWLYRHIPTFSMFQAPARWMLWAVFALALLAGIGAQRWRRPEKRLLYWTRLGTAGAFSILIGAGLGWWLLGEVSPTFVRATAWLGLWCLGSGALSLLAPPAAQAPLAGADQDETLAAGGYPRAWWSLAVAVWVMLDLLVAGWGLNPGGPLSLFKPSPTTESVRTLAQGGRLFIPQKQEYWLKYVRFLRFDTFDPGEDWHNLRAVQMPNTNLLDSLATVNNFDPLVPGRFNDWLAMLAEAPPETDNSLLRLMDVGVVETMQRDQPYGVRFTSVTGGRRLRWVPCQWSVSGPAEALQRMLNGEVDFDTQVLLEAPETAAPAGLSCATAFQTPQITPQTLSLTVDAGNPNLLVIDLDAPGAGWLVLSDVWYPGWQAWVDGRPAKILRANYLFRAVKVEPGSQQVVFSYRPLTFKFGLVCSLCCWLALAALGFWPWSSRLAPDNDSKHG